MESMRVCFFETVKKFTHLQNTKKSKPIIKEDGLLKGQLRVWGHIADTQANLVEEEDFS